ncbi:MAG: SLBB domain-containing protein, partial [Synechococcaceae cyanobacterium]|nr:SLBB domain-containing protein [Synechococcaceae cyanobacterium]
TSSDGRNKVKVMANGAIFMPKGGLVRVAGMTLPQAEKAMKAALRRYYRRPALSIVELAQGSIRVKILGQVQNPGGYKLAPAGSEEEDDQTALRQRPSTLEELIVRAGGLLNNADFQRIEVRPAEGACFSVNLDILQGGASRFGMLALEDGDTVTVPVANEIATRSNEYKWMAKSDLASTKQKIYVIGDVNKPGPVQASWLTTPFEAVAMAGGTNVNASKSVFLARHDAISNSFKVSKVSVDFLSRDVQQGLMEPIPDGSIIYVAKSTVGNLQQFIQNLLTPAALGIGITGAFR